MHNKSTSPVLAASQPKMAEPVRQKPIYSKARPSPISLLRLVQGSTMVVLLAATAGAALGQASAPLPSSRSKVLVTVDGETVQLDMRIYTPADSGRFPTLVFNHGSTGSGRDLGRIKQAVDAPAVAAFFVQRGWAVVMPARRGRADSEGLYDEGFSFIRAWGYSCIPYLSLSGADRALRDIEAAMTAILDMPFVDKERLAMGGISRGGALSVAYAGTHPSQVKAVINFVGGWLGEACPTGSSVNQSVLTRGARYPRESLWLYADKDPYYSLSHSRENFAAFTRAGGKGSFHEFTVPVENGHWLPGFPKLWTGQLDAYLQQSGLPNAAPPSRP